MPRQEVGRHKLSVAVLMSVGIQNALLVAKTPSTYVDILSRGGDALEGVVQVIMAERVGEVDRAIMATFAAPAA